MDRQTSLYEGYYESRYNKKDKTGWKKYHIDPVRTGYTEIQCHAEGGAEIGGHEFVSSTLPYDCVIFSRIKSSPM